MDTQKTLRKVVEFRGRGLHTGLEAQVAIKPADAGSGIVFTHIDQEGSATTFPATSKSIHLGEGRQTSLGSAKARVRTVEHLMATFHGLGIDNAVVEIKGEEIPGFDGSARYFVEKILEAGVLSQDQPREYLYVTEPIYLDEGGQSLIALPYREGLKLSYSLSYQHPDLHDQFFSSVVTPEVFERELAPARTFCLKEEAALLKSQGFGQGADWENTLVFENDRPIKNTLRFPNEACRHKVADLLGDLYLTGRPLRAHIIACRSGHKQNMKLVAKLQETFNQEHRGSNVPMNKQQPNPKSRQLDINEIQKIIPHRYPFLLVDRIIDLVPGERAVGIKNVSMNEYYFQGHFPGHPVMPGVLILEALAQVGGVLMLSRPENRGKLAYFMTIEDVKFRQPVHPGDQLRLEAEVIKIRSKTGQCRGKAYVGDKLVCEAEVKFALVESNA
ncbi:MAG: UDP-3-O-[3-hydroxymyristoyl] N-acetylglucosamine deacetylase [Candidatus Omnitrophica bacterium]|nr:UDP-3-O-[3-hydroxymyristoyl] N-acetylglucosamine deacetylase [Candidatus Omnitrophota bacterium]